MFPTIVTNRFMGREKPSISGGTSGLAEGSSIPMTALGFGESFSRYGNCTIEEQPEPQGVKTLSRSAPSKFASMNKPVRTSEVARVYGIPYSDWQTGIANNSDKFPCCQ